jgi:hypothetical protein
MDALKWFFCLVVGCLACSKSATAPDLVLSNDGPGRVKATLNDSVWYGSAYASASVSLAGETTCTSNRIDIGFATDLPLNSNTSGQAVTGCLEDCVPTQKLVFRNVPLAIGTYPITGLNACAGQHGAAFYYILLGGDSIIKTYSSQGSGIGWIQITGYNTDQKVVEGTFDVELSDENARTARFKNGRFQAVIK